MDKKTLLLYLIQLTFGNNQNIEYIIYTSHDFHQHAEEISKLYTYNDCASILVESTCSEATHCSWTNNCIEIENQIDLSLSLNTQILYSDYNSPDNISPINPEHLSSYLYNNQNGYIDMNNDFYNLKYLLIIGDETIINPMFFSGIPCDDYYSSVNQNSSIPPNPKLITGRILINDTSSFTQINQIKDYVLYPEQGKWKGDMLLFCDDQFKSGKTIRGEKWHTIHSDVIYNSLKNNLNITCLYGPDFERQQSISWYTQPEFNDKIIETINNGVSIINYIGHGTSALLADENILTIADINRIYTADNKLPIWVVGTCSFGDYLNENCLAEMLLQKENAAIAVISTTAGVSYQANFNYLKDFFTIQLKDYLNNQNNFSRIGDIFFESKNSISSSYTFHLFGDPAMPLQIPKYNTNLISPISSINIGSNNSLYINESGNSSLKILDEEKIKNKVYNYGDGEPNHEPNDSCYTYPTIYDCNTPDILSYNLPGNILFNGESSTNYFDYILPIDTDEGNNASIILYNDFSNTISTQSNIDMVIDNNSNTANDYSGPSIDIFHNNSQVIEGSTIYPPYRLRIILSDNLPINLSGLNYHDIRFWIDEDENNSTILNNLFEPSSGSNNEGEVEFYINSDLITKNKHIINIEAWDIFNNQNRLSYSINFFNNTEVYNIFNFPNPFDKKTFFTFNCTNTNELNVEIKIYSFNGKLITSFSEKNIAINSNYFYKIPTNGWDGKDNNNQKIANGTYIYNLKIYTQHEILHQDNYKITKLE